MSHICLPKRAPLVRVAVDTRSLKRSHSTGGFCNTCYKLLISRSHLDSELDAAHSIRDRYIQLPVHEYCRERLFRSLSYDPDCYLCCLLWSFMGLEQKQLYLRARAIGSRSERLEVFDGVLRDVKTKWAHTAQFSLYRFDCADFEQAHRRVTLEVVYMTATWMSGIMRNRVEPLESNQAYSTDSEESWASVAKWMGDCTSSHQVCNNLRENGAYFPTRVLDIESGSTNNLRLVCTDENPVEGRYITLSHRWGNNDFIRLTESNFASLKDCFPIRECPRTFQDMVIVARRLKVRYIWIDSLCIIQDQPSKEDWLKEAPQMGKVYANAYCNVAATAGEDGSQGLFRNRNPHRVFPTAFIHEATNKTVALTRGDYWDNQVSSSPLLQRGWVFQERLLSPRILHFIQDEIVWECCQLRATERLPQGLSSHLVRVNDKGGLSLLLSTLARWSGKWPRYIQDRDFDLETLWLWIGILEEYTRTSVTYTEDKLVALSGLAKLIHAVLQAQYVAGLWNIHLPHQLLWTLQPGDGRPATTYRAPSFSWASMEGRCQWRAKMPSASDRFLELIEVVAIRIKHAGSDNFGPVSGGYMEVRGALLPEPVDENHVKLENMDDVHNFDKGASYFCCPILQAFYFRMPTIYYLILKKVDSELTTFRRVGYCNDIYYAGEITMEFSRGLEPRKQVFRII